MAMPYTTLASGLRVSKLCLGGSAFAFEFAKVVCRIRGSLWPVIGCVSLCWASCAMLGRSVRHGYSAALLNSALDFRNNDVRGAE
jgi:hypothetical protein